MTHILILMVYFWNSEMADAFLQSESRKYQPMKLLNTQFIVEGLNSNVVRNILFIHAWNGCDTTSVAHNHGKTALLKLVEKDHKKVLKICSIFEKTGASQTDIAIAGMVS